MKRKKGFFSISAVAQMFSIHPQTIRLYEQQGLITPKRSEGNTRLFSEEDVSKLEEIVYLTHNLGINLAGVEMVIKLKRQISKLQKELNVVFDNASSELTKQEETSKQAVRSSINRLMDIKKTSKPTQKKTKKSDAQLSLEQAEDWEVQYDE
jgi:MerR family transcriptional regulator/heat shock protein HspR